MSPSSSPIPDLPPDALVEELLHSIGPLVRRLRTEANPTGLSWSQMAVIGRLKRDGPATTSDLARAEGVKPQSMGVTLAVLERGGLVARTADPADGRQFFYDLTPQGHDARTQHRLLKVGWLGSALAKLDEQDTADLRAALHVIRRLGDS